MMSTTEIIDQLTSLKGIGKAKAEALVEHGFDSVEKIKTASLEELTEVTGISDQIATSIQEQLKKVSSETKKPEEKPTEKKEEKAEEITSTASPKKSTSEKKPTKKPKKVELEDDLTEVPIPEYEVKKKPTLSDDLQQKLSIRKQIKKRTPTFLREEWFRYKRIPKNWRRPDGIHSKMRINLKYRQHRVRIGFRGPKQVRGLHSSGFEEVMVYNVHDLEAIDSSTQAARIGGSVGTKKRMAIEEKAKELDIRLLNKR